MGPGSFRYIDAAGRSSGLDAVVHLAEGTDRRGRWTALRKARIRDSRVQGTRLLCEALSHTSRPPATLACASAIGFYGNRGDEVLIETSAGGQGFLAEVCRDWEAAAEPARQKGIRVLNSRFGVILSARGGAARQQNADAVQAGTRRRARLGPPVHELYRARRLCRGHSPRARHRLAAGPDERRGAGPRHES